MSLDLKKFQRIVRLDQLSLDELILDQKYKTQFRFQVQCHGLTWRKYFQPSWRAQLQQALHLSTGFWLSSSPCPSRASLMLLAMQRYYSSSVLYALWALSSQQCAWSRPRARVSCKYRGTLGSFGFYQGCRTLDRCTIQATLLKLVLYVVICCYWRSKMSKSQIQLLLSPYLISY